MAVFEDLMKPEGAGPLVLGVAALMVAPAILPAVGRIFRPVIKGAIKTGIAAYEETYASIKEATNDIIAEARAELEQEHEESRHHAQPT